MQCELCIFVTRICTKISSRISIFNFSNVIFLSLLIPWFKVIFISKLTFIHYLNYKRLCAFMMCTHTLLQFIFTISPLQKQFSQVSKFKSHSWDTHSSINSHNTLSFLVWQCLPDCQLTTISQEKPAFLSSCSWCICLNLKGKDGSSTTSSWFCSFMSKVSFKIGVEGPGFMLISPQEGIISHPEGSR